MSSVKIYGCGLLFSLITSCSVESTDSSNINEDEIFQDYVIDYNQEDQSLTMIAQFKVGGTSGTTVKLIEPSKIEVNNTQLALDDRSNLGDLLRGSFYRVIESNITEPMETYTFKWTLSDGSIMENVIRSANPITITDSLNGQEISKSKIFELNFSGTPENLMLCKIVSLEPYEDVPIGIDVSPTDSKCVFSKDVLEKMPIGNAYISIVNRFKSVPQSVKEVGGRINSYFYTEKEYISIIN